VPVGQQEVATLGWLAPHRRDRSSRQIQGWRKANRTRRLKPASLTFDNSSSKRHAVAISTDFPKPKHSSKIGIATKIATMKSIKFLLYRSTNQAVKIEGSCESRGRCKKKAKGKFEILGATVLKLVIIRSYDPKNSIISPLENLNTLKLLTIIAE